MSHRFFRFQAVDKDEEISINFDSEESQVMAHLNARTIIQVIDQQIVSLLAVST